MDDKLFKVHFLLNLQLSRARLIILLEVIKCLLDLVNIIHLLVIKLQLLVLVLSLVLSSLLQNVGAISEHFIAKVAIKV